MTTTFALRPTDLTARVRAYARACDLAANAYQMEGYDVDLQAEFDEVVMAMWQVLTREEVEAWAVVDSFCKALWWASRTATLSHSEARERALLRNLRQAVGAAPVLDGVAEGEG